MPWRTLVYKLEFEKTEWKPGAERGWPLPRPHSGGLLTLRCPAPESQVQARFS